MCLAQGHFIRTNVCLHGVLSLTVNCYLPTTLPCVVLFFPHVSPLLPQPNHLSPPRPSSAPIRLITENAASSQHHQPPTLTLIRGLLQSSSQTPPWHLGQAWLSLNPPLPQSPLHGPLHLHLLLLLLPLSPHHLLLIVGDKTKMKKFQVQVLTQRFHLHLLQSLRTVQVWSRSRTSHVHIKPCNQS